MLGQQVLRAEIVDIVDIADIATDIADIVNIAGICRLDVANIIVKTDRRVQGVIGVSHNSTPALNSSSYKIGLW